MYRPMAVALALATLLPLALDGCGKAGRPLQPPDSVYPRTYPNPNEGVPQKKDGALPPEWDQQDMNARFTKEGSYIDPSAAVPQTNSIPLNSNLPNTTRASSTDPFSQGLSNSGQSSLPSNQAPPSDETTSPTDQEEQAQ